MTMPKQANKERKIIKIYTVISFCFLIAIFFSCYGAKAHRLPPIKNAIISYGGATCLQTENYILLAHPHIDTGKLLITDTLYLGLSGSVRLLEYSPAARKVFFADDDTVWAYDILRGVRYILTSGAFSKNVQCARLSQDGKYLAFTASPWNIGKMVFWRLVVVNAFEGGILHYCDSLPSPDAFQWVRPARVGYAVYAYSQGEFDTIGTFYDVERNVTLPSRDRGIDFLKIPCDPKISPDGQWRLEIIDSIPQITEVPHATSNRVE